MPHNILSRSFYVPGCVQGERSAVQGYVWPPGSAPLTLPSDSNLHHSFSPAVRPLQHLFCQSLFRQTSCAQHTCPGQRSHSSVLQVSGERAKLLWCVRSFACSTQTPAELGTPYARHSRAETKRLECSHPCVIYCWFFHMPQQKRILFWGFQRVKGQWPYRCTKGGHG